TGGTIDVQYQPAPQVMEAVNFSRTSPGIPNAAPRQLVTRVTTSDGRGSSVATEYRYQDGRIFPGLIPLQRSLGFAAVDKVGVATGQWSRTRYLQDPPYEGQVGSVEAFAGDGQRVAGTDQYYDVVYPAAGTEFVRTVTTVASVYESGVFANSQVTSNTYD